MKKFKSYDDFVNENSTRQINEDKEKFKVKTAKPSHAGGESAFMVKYIGSSFDEQMLRTFMQDSPVSSSSLQKVQQEPSQYFFIYKTLKSGEHRFLAPNTFVWATYLELINAVGPDGKPMYSGFDKPPYNNFVKWTNASSLITGNDQAGQAIVNAVNTSGTAQAENEINSTDTQTAKVDANNNATDPNVNALSNNPQTTRAANPAQSASTAPSSHSQSSTPPAASPVIQTDMETSELVDSFEGLKLGSNGLKVGELQRMLWYIAKLQKNDKAMSHVNGSINQSGNYDEIYGPETAAALGLILNLNSPVNAIDDATVLQIKTVLANNKIKSSDIAKASPNSVNQTPPGHGATPPPANQAKVVAPATQAATAKSTPAAPATNIAAGMIGPQSSRNLATRSIETNKGKIYY